VEFGVSFVFNNKIINGLARLVTKNSFEPLRTSGGLQDQALCSDH